MRMDLNSDLGESFGAWRLGDDEALLDVVTSANIACGFHAGDPSTIRQTVAAAHARGVLIGAQVSYPDLVGFGRREMSATPEQIEHDVLYQLGALHAFCKVAGTRVRFLRPHGALYHRCASDPEAAAAAVRSAAAFDDTLGVVAPPNSALLHAAQAVGLEVVREGFADRRYTADGRLHPRAAGGAVLSDRDDVVAQAVAIATGGDVITVDGTAIKVVADTICLHGDTPGAAGMANAVRSALQAHGVTIAPALK